MMYPIPFHPISFNPPTIPYQANLDSRSNLRLLVRKKKKKRQSEKKKKKGKRRDTMVGYLFLKSPLIVHGTTFRTSSGRKSNSKPSRGSRRSSRRRGGQDSGRMTIMQLSRRSRPPPSQATLMKFTQTLQSSQGDARFEFLETDETFDASTIFFILDLVLVPSIVMIAIIGLGLGPRSQ